MLQEYRSVQHRLLASFGLPPTHGAARRGLCQLCKIARFVALRDFFRPEAFRVERKMDRGMNSTSVPIEGCAVPYHLSSGAFSLLRLEETIRSSRARHSSHSAITAGPIFHSDVPRTSAAGSMHRVTWSGALPAGFAASVAEPKRSISSAGHSSSEQLGPLQNASTRWLKEKLQ
jgi:hypothetical protein